MSKILLLSGKKQCGKNTTANLFVGLNLASHVWTDDQGNGFTIEQFYIDAEGRLRVPFDDVTDPADFGVFDVTAPHSYEMAKFVHETLSKKVKLYSFGEKLKLMIHELFDVPLELVFGDNAKKEEYTKLKWSDMPNSIYRAFGYTKKTLPKKKRLTVRELLQAFGTNVLREFYSDIWVDYTMRKIESEDVALAIVTDCRFPNEIAFNKDAMSWRFTRQPFEDNHESETMLDADKFDWKKFSAVIDNKDCNIPQHLELVYNQAKVDGLLPESIADKKFTEVYNSDSNLFTVK